MAWRTQVPSLMQSHLLQCWKFSVSAATNCMVLSLVHWLPGSSCRISYCIRTSFLGASLGQWPCSPSCLTLSCRITVCLAVFLVQCHHLSVKVQPLWPRIARYRETISAIPSIARYGVFGVSTWPNWMRYPLPFSERFPLGEHAKWRCDTHPPPHKGVSQRYLHDTT